MGSFKRALLGYRRVDVDVAIAARDGRIGALERDVENSIRQWREAADAVESAERELESLSGMVIERERELRNMDERLREAEARHDRSIASLESVAARLEEVEAQARGQATRIRMKALRDAAEVSRRAEAMADRGETSQAGAEPQPGTEVSPVGDSSDDSDLFEGALKLEIGPLGDFSQLVGFEEAVGGLGASEISVERFSEGRATLSMHLDEPVALLRELEERAPLEFRVRRTGDNLILDVDEDAGPPDQQAA